MGALFEGRKRFPDLSPLSPPSKKAKTSSPPSVLHRTAPERRFPPMAPIRRPIHGPQRVVRAFGFGSGWKPRPEVRIWRSGSGAEVESVEGLDLDEYRRLVVEVEEAEAPTASEAVTVDLRGLDLEAAEEEAAPMEEEEEEESPKSSRRRRVPLYRDCTWSRGGSTIRGLGIWSSR
ncbi:putative ubiquitin-like-specific protease 1B [Iris pallida]|uniref:Ubiquitin-like-specific protease 1B n=1 Tax=Iris pallida TaxID=29817 RepID=A0AAX6E4F5_IRIPA|nr:putative ubiquitin-like-specific protease 1B [Iris pallida]